MARMSTRNAIYHWAETFQPVQSHGAVMGTATTLYSYAMPIAIRLGNNVVIVNKDKYSVTTSKHQGYLRGALSSAGVPWIEEDEATVLGLERYGYDADTIAFFESRVKAVQ